MGLFGTFKTLAQRERILQPVNDLRLFRRTLHGFCEAGRSTAREGALHGAHPALDAAERLSGLRLGVLLQIIDAQIKRHAVKAA
jgi:hypothetical protein